MRLLKPLSLTIALLCCMSGTMLHAEQAPRIPTFAQCQRLASAKTSAQEKAQLTQLFKSRNFYCSMSSAPFNVQRVFSTGQSKTQVRLIMGPHNKYIMDAKNLLDVLLPDRVNIPPAQMIMLAGQFIGMLGEMFSSENSIPDVSGHVGPLVGVLGINARIAAQQLSVLRAQARLNEEDIEPSFWLTHLSRIEAPSASPTQSPAQGTGWMQKAMGAAKHLMGTFSE